VIFEKRCFDALTLQIYACYNQ